MDILGMLIIYTVARAWSGIRWLGRLVTGRWYYR